MNAEPGNQMLKDLITVAIGGALGAGGRYLVGIFSRGLLGGDFPWGTFAVNAIGCFGIGLAAGRIGDTQNPAWLFLVVGLLGGFTTFSAFGHETIQLLLNDNYTAATLNVILQVALGLAAVWAGMALAKAF